MPRVRSILSGCLTIVTITCATGCSIQDVFRSTLGGVNSDRSALNKVNPSNEQSFPQADPKPNAKPWPNWQP